MSRPQVRKAGVPPSTNSIPNGPNVRSYLLPVFTALLLSHTAAALYAPIQDCDEVFNYWEPTHYLTHGYGMQTWEYAPQYAIRSWSYAGLHAVIIASANWLLPALSKHALFYTLRYALGVICATCETIFFTAIAKVMNERVAILYVMITTASPGMYHASVAYLPSSFAMYAAISGAAAFMSWHGEPKTAQGILWFGIGACWGWPFAVALSAPFLLERLFWAWLSDKQGRLQVLRKVVSGTVYALQALILQCAIDSKFYGKFVAVPFNIVLYNVFSSKGPDLYGTEPWHFYIRNLALNFHVWLLLALLGLPLLVIQLLMDRKWTSKARGLAIMTPLYLWLAIFTLQPHKEERFMYPAYPFLILSAAYTLNTVLAFLGNSRKESIVSGIPVMIRLTAILAFLAMTFALTALRVTGTWTSFGAPLRVYEPLTSMSIGGNVCLGKEWYRFPSHYLLPVGFHAKFIRSEFHGLLPGEFQTDLLNGTTSWYAGASATPAGMNDENLEDPGKYVDLSQCDFLVDSNLSSTITTQLEPDYISDSKTWRALKCVPFLDAASTPVIPRLIWTPDIAVLPASMRRVWGQYCLLQRSNE